MPMKNWRSRNMKKALPKKAGTIKGLYVLYQPIFWKMTNCGCSGGYIARISSHFHPLASPSPFVVEPEAAGAEQDHRNEDDYNERHPREGHSVAQPEVAERVLIEVQHVAQPAVLRAAVDH